jgi:hypothetical protein
MIGTSSYKNVCSPYRHIAKKENIMPVGRKSRCETGETRKKAK